MHTQMHVAADWHSSRLWLFGALSRRMEQQLMQGQAYR